jgi:catechol 2,3-dioxygenase-like lactoylglutathione lyase family enzyme
LDSPGFSHLGLLVEDFAAFEQRLKAHNVKLWGVRTTSHGWKIGYFNDPEGNVLEIIQR